MNKEELLAYLKTERLMGLSTVNDDGTLWSAIVYYIVDEELNLYFLSKQSDKHSTNITKNKNVACTIYDSKQILSGEKLGVQYSGTATVVTQLERLKWMVEMWKEHIAMNPDEDMNPKDFLEAGNSKIYKISPTYVKFFNTQLYEEKFKIWEPK